MRRLGAAACLGVLAALAAGCGSGTDRGSQLTVFAASSLREVLPRIDAEPEYVFAGSNQLAAQLRDGAQADVFLSASEEVARDLFAADLLERPQNVASNRLVVVAPRDSTRVRMLRDLVRPGVKLVLGASGVPAGDYAREALPRAGLGAALDNVVSLEDDVKGVVSKVALGEADAGVVYATDARAAADDVRTMPLPAAAQPAIAYVAAVVSDTDYADRARAFVGRLRAREGQAAFVAAGFLPPRG